MLHGGLTVYTTLVPHTQDVAQKAVTELVEQGRKEGYGMHEGALVAEDPRTGEILAMVGGIGFSAKNQFNRAWQARRQPGSSFKGYVYSTAVDRGTPVSSIYSDSPVTYPAGDGTEYSPSDDDHRFLGPMTLRKAFALSRNVVAVKLAYDVGIDNVVQYAHAMGITEDLEAGSVAGAWHGGRIAARYGVRLLDDRGRRDLHAAHGHPLRHRSLRHGRP